jgi:UDP-N-acetylmuramoyl-L-alanyl-D-glutamate--2,6-diaminopimelate ligase
MQGITKAGALRKTKEVGDRREAIAAAITTAQKNDVIVLAGMGHEQFRIVAGKRLPWNDAQAARTILRKQ